MTNTPALGTMTAQVLYLFLPLAFSSALAGIVWRTRTLGLLAKPIDHGATFRGRRVFGDNKTWRGLACAIVGCTIAVAVQKYVIGERVGDVALIDYDTANVLALGAALGVGAIAGELPNSFLKRQLDIAPGATGRRFTGALFYVFDQVDLLLVVWPLLLFWVIPTWELVLISFLMVFLFHQVITGVGRITGLRNR
jgi:CDP-archaeol synthase